MSYGLRRTRPAQGLRRCLLAALLLAPAEARAVDYLNVSVEPDRAVPAACFSFSAPLPRSLAGGFAPFVEVSPKGDHALEPRGQDLCLAGLKHGDRYTVRLKAGLPAADGTALPKDVSVEVAVPDREARVTFDNRKTVLPYAAGVGLPLKSVNVAKAHVTVYRIGERALVGGGTDQMGQDLDGSGLSGIADKSAEVFDGTVDIAAKPNREVATALPVDALLKGLKPGVYVAAAWPADRQPDESDTRATQWFSVSDIGLVTVKADDGLLVSARSLRTALPLADVAIALVAKSDEVLATWRTGADGLVTVPAGLLRGEGGNAPRMLTASAPNGSFTPVNLDAPALDLSALDLKGRAPPGPLDAYLWTDRGIYRPGGNAACRRSAAQPRRRRRQGAPHAPPRAAGRHRGRQDTARPRARGRRYARRAHPRQCLFGRMDALGRVGRHGAARLHDRIGPGLRAAAARSQARRARRDARCRGADRRDG